jgi:predicted DNA-binding antitoxin AbrB/MazE fold protein
MDTIPVIYENGVFRPTVPVILPEATTGKVTVTVDPEAIGTDSDEIYEILERRYSSGCTDGGPRRTIRERRHSRVRRIDCPLGRFRSMASRCLGSLPAHQVAPPQFIASVIQ